MIEALVLLVGGVGFLTLMAILAVHRRGVGRVCAEIDRESREDRDGEDDV